MSVILICGTRGNYTQIVHTYMDALGLPITTLVIHGGCKSGADRHVKHWCRRQSIHTAVIDALWYTMSASAGPIRNEVMVQLTKKLGGRAIAFWDGKSSGTESTIDLCEQYGVDCTVVDINLA